MTEMNELWKPTMKTNRRNRPDLPASSKLVRDRARGGAEGYKIKVASKNERNHNMGNGSYCYCLNVNINENLTILQSLSL